MLSGNLNMIVSYFNFVPGILLLTAIPTGLVNRSILISLSQLKAIFFRLIITNEISGRATMYISTHLVTANSDHWKCFLFPVELTYLRTFFFLHTCLPILHISKMMLFFLDPAGYCLALNSRTQKIAPSPFNVPFSLNSLA